MRQHANGKGNTEMKGSRSVRSSPGIRAMAVATILVWSSLVPVVTTAASAQQGAPQPDLSGDTQLLTVELTDASQDSSGAWHANVQLQNEHPLWYVVKASGLAVPGAQLASWALLPPCRVEQLTNYVCDDARATLGQIPMNPRTDLTLFADATGSTDDSAKILEAVYGAELVWRVGLHQPLPTDIGDGLQEIGTTAAEKDLDLWNVGDPVLGPLQAFYRIGEAAKSGDLLGAADAIKDAVSDETIRGWIVSKWPGLEDDLPVVGQAVDAVEVGVAVGELPLTWGSKLSRGWAPRTGPLTSRFPMSTHGSRLRHRLAPTTKSLKRPSGIRATPRSANWDKNAATVLPTVGYGDCVSRVMLANGASPEATAFSASRSWVHLHFGVGSVGVRVHEVRAR